MSLNYARELLKISISQLCDAIGFDTTSEIAIDILVDVCERQFQYLSKQTSNLIQLNNRYEANILDIISILPENFDNLHEYMSTFPSLQFSQDIIKFPYKKRNQFCLRIPPKDSQQVIERDQNESTDYIYDWLPLFPDQETPEQAPLPNIPTTLDATVYIDQDKKIDKSDSHHPLTLLSFLSKNGDEQMPIPIGKRPNPSLPSILYRPRRIIEMEAAAAAVEKAKKEQIEKENNEKDQQQGPPPPLRLTIPKPLVNTEKAPLPIKKPTIDGTINKKPLSTPLLNTNTPSINLGKKTILSPTINNHSNETHSQPNPPTNSSEILIPNFDKNEGIILDLSKPSNPPIPPVKVPKIKLNFKNVSTPQITNNSEMPPTATKKSQQSTINNKPLTTIHEKVNLKIRTTSLPTFEKNSGINESIPMISPPINLSNDIRIPSIEPSTNVNSSIIDNKQTTEIIDSTNHVDQSLLSKNLTNEEEKKKKKKKKHHDDREQKEEKKFKKEQENNQMDIEPIPLTTNKSPINSSSTTSQPIGGAIRLKIKLGKPSIPINNLQSKISDDISISSTNNNNNHNDNEHRPNSETKPNTIIIPSPTITSNSQPIAPLTIPRPPIISTINRTPNRRKSGKVTRVPQINETKLLNSIISTPNISFQDDNTVSIDDLPLGERTSPNKITILNNIQTTLPQQIISTPIKKKPTTINKKKTNNNKRPNNIVGVAVIEERRIHHDSQEKIWICPSCNRPDNGQEAMIACDLCDDWYHWECVGIVEEPPESISWFCPKCHRSNSSTASAQGIKPSASSKAKRKRASALYQQKQQQQYPLI